MSASMSLRGFFSQTTKLVFDFMHGGLVMAGVVLTLALVAFVAGNPAAVDGLRAMRQVLVAGTPSALRLDAPAEEEEDSTTVAKPLAGELRAALDHVARRYRVSALALEPVFEAAQSTGRQLNLDPLLIIAIIGVESGFNPLSESVVGAQGLMQIVPRFHLDKLPADNPRLALFDPETNIGVGARILKDSIRRMGGLMIGLQQFAGAVEDPDQVYANKVIAEKQRLEAAARRGRGSTAG